MRRAIGALALMVVACKRAPPPTTGTLPPSGYYDVHYEVTSWGCSTNKPSPFTVTRMAVETTGNGGGTILHANVWADDLGSNHFNPVGQGDLPLRPGEKRTVTIHPKWNCGATLNDTIETEVTGVSHQHLRLKVTRIYGDTSVCQNPRLEEPTRCRAEASVDFTLVESKCELPWTGREQFTASGALEMHCYHAL